MARSKKSLHETYGPDAPRALSMGMRDMAEQVSMPGRFMEKSGPRSSCVVIFDRETGRQVEVPLFAYRTVREVLGTLFSQEDEVTR